MKRSAWDIMLETHDGFESADSFRKLSEILEILAKTQIFVGICWKIIVLKIA